MLAIQQPRDLHGQRRGARDDALMRDELPSGPRHGQDIDAAVLIKPTILEVEQHVEIALVHRIDGDRQTPAAFRRGEGAQQVVVAIHHSHRQPVGALQRRRAQRIHRQPHRGVEPKRR